MRTLLPRYLFLLDESSIVRSHRGAVGHHTSGSSTIHTMELFDMRTSRLLAGAVLTGLFAAALPGPLSSQDVDEGRIGPSPYDIIEGWHVPFAKQGFAFGGNSGVWAESPDRIIVAQRGETRLPIPIPSEFSGYAGSIGINTLSATDLRTWQNCLYTLDRNGNVTDIWEQWDYLCAGSEGPGPHRIRISPYDPARRIWLVKPKRSSLGNFRVTRYTASANSIARCHTSSFSNRNIAPTLPLSLDSCP